MPRPSTQHGCKYWSSLAYNLTHIHERVGDMMHMYCVNNNNSDHGGCQEMRCGGRLQQKLPVSDNFNPLYTNGFFLLV